MNKIQPVMSEIIGNDNDKDDDDTVSSFKV